jgi:hypothetical protein
MLDPVDLLLDELVNAGRGKWPPPREVEVARTIRTHRAFLESDREALRLVADWPADRGYKVDPLPALIADAWADHLFGDDLTIAPADEADAGLLDLLLDGNGDLTGNLHAAEREVVAEGEKWWRIYVDTDVADVPLLEWHSRDAVIPLYVGGRLKAVAFVTELDGRGSTVYRHLEVHADGVVEHVAFRGTRTRIGATVRLDTVPGLEELAKAVGESQRWDHGLGMLAGRITNGRGQDRRTLTGVSDYARIADYLLDLNEAVTIGAENVRLTAKRRVVVPESAVQPAGPELVDRGDGSFERRPRVGFDAGEDVLVSSSLDAELGTAGDGVFKVLEYSFDASALIAYKRDTVESALTRVGLTPQYVGVVGGEGGLALSGTALRLRLIPTTKAGRGKARPWDDELPVILGRMAELDRLPTEAGGFGRGWAAAEVPPAVERGEALPTDDVEEANVEATLVGAGVRSIFTSVKGQHPDWDDELVEAEVERIKADKASGASNLGGIPGLA